MRELIFTVYGPPVGKQRARSSSRSKRHFTPKKTVEYEKSVARAAFDVVLKTPRYDPSEWTGTEQVYLDLWIYHANGRKPDSDNVVKAVEDGLTGILWKDDRNVLPRVHHEYWPDDNPRVVVRIKPTGCNPGKKGKK